MPPDAKRTKRLRDASESMTLEEHIASRRMQLVQERREAPELRAKAALLRARVRGLRCRWQQREAADAMAEAQELEQEAAARESMAREHDFEATVVTYLRRYHQKGTEEANSTVEEHLKHHEVTTQRKEDILDEYLTEMNQAPAKVAMAARDECPRCATPLLLCTRKSCLTCRTCGYAVTYLDVTSASTAFDEVVDYSQYSYKRVSHFMMWLQLTQGKEAHRVPLEILQKVMHHFFYEQKVTDPEQITQKRVRETLRKLRLRKAYDHVAQVTARISGKPPLRISAHTEEQLKNMFLRMQPAFQRHAPKSRTNFLSYPYTLYRCFQILGLHHMTEGISLLKGRDKLEANDAIFRNMCIHDLGWPVFDLPPA